MKIIYERDDEEDFLEIVLTKEELEQIDRYQIANDIFKIRGQKYRVGVRSELPGE